MKKYRDRLEVLYSNTIYWYIQGVRKYSSEEGMQKAKHLIRMVSYLRAIDAISDSVADTLANALYDDDRLDSYLKIEDFLQWVYEVILTDSIVTQKLGCDATIEDVCEYLDSVKYPDYYPSQFKRDEFEFWKSRTKLVNDDLLFFYQTGNGEKVIMRMPLGELLLKESSDGHVIDTSTHFEIDHVNEKMFYQKDDSIYSFDLKNKDAKPEFYAKAKLEHVSTNGTLIISDSESVYSIYDDKKIMLFSNDLDTLEVIYEDTYAIVKSAKFCAGRKIVFPRRISYIDGKEEFCISDINRWFWNRFMVCACESNMTNDFDEDIIVDSNWHDCSYGFLFREPCILCEKDLVQSTMMIHFIEKSCDEKFYISAVGAINDLMVKEKLKEEDDLSFSFKKYLDGHIQKNANIFDDLLEILNGMR